MASSTRESQVVGCMVGLAAGDALGASFVSANVAGLLNACGRSGDISYKLDSNTGKALITADTQMALFAANGLLWGETRTNIRGIGGPASGYVERALVDWYRTQGYSMSEVMRIDATTAHGRVSWLLNIPEFYASRAPGATCMDVLAKLEKNEEMPKPRSNSKGCGAIVRVIPLALHKCFGNDHAMKLNMLETEGARVAAITHGHPVSEISAAFLVHLIRSILQTDQSILSSVKDTIGWIYYIYGGNNYSGEVNSLICKAIKMASDALTSDIVAIRQLGTDWTADQVLAVAIYCAVKYENDFSAGLIASVKHEGISNVTGALTGAILGAKLGQNNISSQWTSDLQLLNVITELAQDLYYGCPEIEVGSSERKRRWFKKYFDKKYNLDDLNQ